MDAEREVLRDRAHFDGEHAFGDQFACAHSYDADAQYALGLRIEDEFGHAFGAVDGHGAAGCSPGELGDFDFAIFFLRMGFGQACPGDFGIGEDHGGNGVGLKCDFVTRDGFDRGSSFMRGFMRQHGFADYVSDGVDGGVVGLQLLVDLDESARTDFDLSFVEAGNFGIGFASD